MKITPFGLFITTLGIICGLYSSDYLGFHITSWILLAVSLIWWAVEFKTSQKSKIEKSKIKYAVPRRFIVIEGTTVHTQDEVISLPQNLDVILMEDHKAAVACILTKDQLPENSELVIKKLDKQEL